MASGAPLEGAIGSLLGRLEASWELLGASLGLLGGFRSRCLSQKAGKLIIIVFPKEFRPPITPECMLFLGNSSRI